MLLLSFVDGDHDAVVVVAAAVVNVDAAVVNAVVIPAPDVVYDDTSADVHFTIQIRRLSTLSSQLYPFDKQSTSQI